MPSLATSMRVTLVRNATLLLEIGTRRVLVDPALDGFPHDVGGTLAYGDTFELIDDHHHISSTTR
jgi:L-ascorbate metabolism protein UlaG (beta-lactamase superfamily)